MSALPPGPRAAPAATLALFILMPLAACTNKNATLGVSVVPAPQAAVKFSSDVMPILADPQRGGCTISGCHSGASASANMNLEGVRIFDLSVGAVNVNSCEAPGLKRIAAFNSDGSYLIHKLEGTQMSAMCASCPGWTVGPSCGLMMPLGSTMGLSAADIRIIRDWIDQGAPDN